MALDPLKVIAECLGEPADSMRSPATVEYRCPFIDRTCKKINHSNTDPLPVCSIFSRSRQPHADKLPVCVCPVRFYEVEIARDAIEHCWVGPKPDNPRLAYEVGMEKFGNVDLVIADVDDEQRRLRSFLPVELQAVDITGSYFRAYEALINHQDITDRISYSFNWANVRKRFISQIITKGAFCSRWGTRIVAVIQEDLFARFTAHSSVTETVLEGSNIVFMLYQYSRNTENGGWTLSLRRVVPTTHANVMQSILYEVADRGAFEARILARL